MKSPFPGMDPYLEKHWRDIHARLVIYAGDQLQESLPSDLRARVEERVLLESEADRDHNVYPDVRVVEYAHMPRAGTAVLEEPAVADKPLVVHLDDEPATETFLKIIDVGSGNRVVTIVEILSPSNKTPGADQRKYREKQDELRRSKVSLVEIDLLRAGKHVTNIPKSRIPRSYQTTYHVCVTRASKPNAVEIYRVPLRKRLPVIQVPLRPTDKDVTLDLQPLIDQCYRNGRYDTIDYTQPADPPLDPADAEWADQLLREKALRK